MTRPERARRRAAAVGVVMVAALVAGCTLLSPRHDPSRFYTLSARVPVAVPPAGRAVGFRALGSAGS